MFPTTVWTMIRDAGAADRDALERFARSYRAPVLHWLAARGLPAQDAEDLCQDVFVRVLKGDVLARADAARGRFRSLLLTVATRTVQDRLRRRAPPAARDDLDPVAAAPDFDREWVLHLTERALERLERESPGYHGVVRRHLDGERVDRQKLWLARRKLVAAIRHEIALTCRSPEEFEEELAHLAPYLRGPGARAEKP